jgi:hypothetical protein
MAKSIYGYVDMFSPEHIYMSPRDKAAFKFLIENENYDTCKAGREYYSIKRTTKAELIKDFTDRMNEFKSYHATSKMAKFTFAFNANRYEEKIGILKESHHNDFVYFEGKVLFKAN